MAGINRVELKTLKDFYALMAASRDLRRRAVAAILNGDKVDGGILASLSNLLESLEAVPEEEGGKRPDHYPGYGLRDRRDPQGPLLPSGG